MTYPEGIKARHAVITPNCRVVQGGPSEAAMQAALRAAGEAEDKGYTDLDVRLAWALDAAYTIDFPRPSAALVEAARALAEKLEAIHNDERYLAVWQLAQFHAGPYTGPRYTDELAALRRALLVG